MHARFARGTLLPLALVFITLATRVPFMYTGGMPEPDSVIMAAGMAKALDPNVSLGDATLYGRQLSPAMYILTDAVYPLFFDSPRHMIMFLNWLAVIAASLLAWPLYSLARASMPARAAAGAVFIAMFSPVVWEFGTFFHPLVPSCLLLFVALACARRVARSTAGVLWMVLTLLCAALALVIRAEVLFVLPAILVWSALCPGRRARNISLALSTTLFALVCYLLIERMFPSATETQAHGVRSYVSWIYGTYTSTFSLAALDRSSVWAVLSVGTATTLAATVGVVRYVAGLRRRDARRWSAHHANVAVGLIWVLPSLCFWLPQPTPIMRHYVLAALGIAWLVGYLVLRTMSARGAAVVTVTVIVVSLLVPELAYRVYNTSRPGDAKTPHGAFFYEQQTYRRSIARHREMAEEVMRAANREGSVGAAVLVNWTGYAYVLYGLYAGDLPVTRMFQERNNPNVSNEQFRIDGRELRVVQGIRLTPDSEPARAAAAYLIDAARDGLDVFVPAEAASAGLTSERLGFDVTTY